MSRNFSVYGETLVYVQGVKGSAIASNQELGLSVDPIKIMPDLRHQKLFADDFASEIPPELLYMLTGCRISMTLVHFDESILEACIQESMCGGSSFGGMVGAGTMMGGGAAFGATGNHYIQLTLYSTNLGQWIFLTCYLTDRPVEIPVGTERSLVKLNWYAIPYAKPSVAITLKDGSPNVPAGTALSDMNVSYSELVSAGIGVWSKI